MTAGRPRVAMTKLMRSLGFWATMAWLALNLACSDAVVTPPQDTAQGDTGAKAPVVPPPPQCPPGPWFKVLISDGPVLRWQCAPDFPVWGDQPLSPATLAVDAPGTATDSLTGLQWQLAPGPTALTQQAAAEACDDLVLASHSDWRLPTVAELQSLVDYERHHPAQPSLLPAPTGTAEFWTLVQRGDGAWSVEFLRGQVRVRPRHQAMQVRCVRSERPPSVPYTDRFSFKNAETAADALLQVEWLRNVVVNTYTMPQTVGWCTKANISGPGWRVPNVRELSALVDRSASPTAIDSSVFGGASATIWTYSISADDPGYVWSIDFSNGTCAAMEMQSFQDIRCVRELK